MNPIMTIRAPEGLRSQLKSAAEEQGVTVNGLTLQILWQWLENRNSPSADGQGGNSDG